VLVVTFDVVGDDAAVLPVEPSAARGCVGEECPKANASGMPITMTMAATTTATRARPWTGSRDARRPGAGAPEGDVASPPGTGAGGGGGGGDAATKGGGGGVGVAPVGTGGGGSNNAGATPMGGGSGGGASTPLTWIGTDGGGGVGDGAGSWSFGSQVSIWS
jgi:hypothetical protein